MGETKPPRVNVIGRGPWGQNIVRTLKKLGAEVPVIANRETGWQAAFEGEPDRICVAAHPSVNLPVVLECDKRGIPVWIEKPAALCLADVEKMAECTVPIFVDYTYLYQDAEKSCVELLAGVMSARCHDYGMVYDWAPHALALAADLRIRAGYEGLGEPLQNALQVFLRREMYWWPKFNLTTAIHRIIDAAEKRHAAG